MLRKALVVGINSYPLLKKNLETPAGDAEQMACLLKDFGGFQIVKRLPVTTKEGSLRVDEKQSGEQLVTSEKLEREIAELFKPEGNDIPDTALLYFAGHGLRKICGGIVEGFLATSDAKPEKNIWGVSFNWLQRLLQSSPVREQIIWLDCCYSGELLNGKFINFDEADPGERGQGRSRCFIAACGDYQVAYGNAEHGILTSILLQALNPQSREVGQWINNHELARFIYEQLDNDEILQTFPQRPSCTNSGGDIKLIQGAKQSRKVVTNSPQENICPYKGLAAFDFNDEDPKYFFGRTALTDELLEKLRLGSFLAVVGASGSGKSSVVKAGLLYQLKLGQRLFGSSEWRILPVIRPGETPLHSLAQAFVGRDGKTAVRLLKQELHVNGAEALNDIIAENFEDDSRVVLVIDQFEEAFTLCQDVKERQQFFDCLLGALNSTKLCLVITMRADFFGECANYPQLAKQIQKYLVTLTPMTTEELTEAIINPAFEVGLEVEDALVSQIIADVHKSSGSLALLQFTLTELWHQRDRNLRKLTISAYQKMEGVMGALDRHAQQIYNYIDYKSASPSQKREPKEQEWIRRIFLKLIRTSEGAKDTRQPQLKTKLIAIAEDDLQQSALSQLIEELIQGRLLVALEVDILSGEYSENVQIIDLAHEALMSGWKEFEQWREKYRQILRLRDSVDDALRVWDANGRKDQDLIMGGLLERARENWLDLQLELDVIAKEFYQKSDDYEKKQVSIQQNISKVVANTFKNLLPKLDNFSNNNSGGFPKIVFSFCGKSLLERQFDFSSDSYECLEFINIIYNCNYEEIYNNNPQALEIIDTFRERAIQKLNNGDIQTIKHNSSELNVIYELYNNNLELGKKDIHFLISNDTVLGHETSDILSSFLIKKGLNVQCYNPYKFSMIDSQNFFEGVDQLLVWLDKQISSCQGYYKVYFNLVGIPNALQAYMDIIGMFYADQLIYLLEGVESHLIRIPKLPIQIDTSGIDPIKFTFMELGSLPLKEVENIPRIFISIFNDGAILSDWGRLIWEKCKKDLLSDNLLRFPYLDYEYSFIKDYENTLDVNKRAKLQETLAKISYLLIKYNGSIEKISQDNGLHFVMYQNRDRLYHFRVSQGLRVSCMFSNGTLRLRRYSYHDDVAANP